MAVVTLSQGIEVAILDMVPEITEVVDVTDHAFGANLFDPGRQQSRCCAPRSAALSSAAYLATIESVAAVRSSASTTSARREAGTAQVLSVAGMPVRTRDRAQPTLATTSPCSLAAATMWHWGLPSIRRPGRASESTIRARADKRRSTTSGSIGVSVSGPYVTAPGFCDTNGICGTMSMVTQPESSRAATSPFVAASSIEMKPWVRLPTEQLA